MITKMDINGKSCRRENGAALVTVLMITVLLGIACIALLSSVGAGSRNTTDVLSETKAYYAAESGIQATVNVLRNTKPTLSYKEALKNNGTLQNYLNYDYTNPNNSSDKRVVIGQAATDYAANPNGGTAYKVTVTDPDNSSSQTTFTTFGGFGKTNLSYSTFYKTPDISGQPDQWTKIEWAPNATNPTTINFSTPDESVKTLLGAFRVTKGPAGGGTMEKVYFQVSYRLILPGNPTWTISGSIETNGNMSFLSAKYRLMGSNIELCSTSDCSTSVPTTITMPASNSSADTNLYAKFNAREPQRLILTALGYGTNGARKQLEAVIQKNPLNGLNSAAAVTIIGPPVNPYDPNDKAVFEAGNSAKVTYSGNSTGGINVPSFGFNDPTNLNTGQTWIAGHLEKPGQVTPAPSLLTSDIPEWQQTPLALNTKVQEYYGYAVPILRVFKNNEVIADPGLSTASRGITFCDGDCTVKGDGGGVLVVRGKLTSLGGFTFKGTIIVVGAGGWERSGGGCGEIVGNVVIAPYTLTPAPTFLPPKYKITGAGCSDVIYAGIDDIFNGENSAISNHVVGVSEK